jgi:predicted amidophosphoribosyltransferase
MFHRLIYFAFPAQCAACRGIGSGLCERCAPFAAPIERKLETLQVRGLGEYGGAFRRAIHALKDGRHDVADALGERLAPFFGCSDLLVPVPTTAARRRVRGADGVERIATIAAAKSGASVLLPLRCVSREAQRGRNREERLSARNRFICTSDVVTGARITLVDDVCTTGATLEDCAAALRNAGALVSGAFVAAIAFTARTA